MLNLSKSAWINVLMSIFEYMPTMGFVNTEIDYYRSWIREINGRVNRNTKDIIPSLVKLYNQDLAYYTKQLDDMLFCKEILEYIESEN